MRFFCLVLVLSAFIFNKFALANRKGPNEFFCPETITIDPKDGYQFTGQKNSFEFKFTTSGTGKNTSGFDQFICYYGKSRGGTYNFYSTEALSVSSANCPYGAMFDIVSTIPIGMEQSYYTGSPAWYLYEKRAAAVNSSSSKKKGEKIKVDCYYGGPNYPYYDGIINTTGKYSKCEKNSNDPRRATCK